MGKAIGNVPFIVTKTMTIQEAVTAATHLQFDNIIVKSESRNAINSIIGIIKVPNQIFQSNNRY